MIFDETAKQSAIYVAGIVSMVGNGRWCRYQCRAGGIFAVIMRTSFHCNRCNIRCFSRHYSIAMIVSQRLQITNQNDVRHMSSRYMPAGTDLEGG